MIAGEVPAQKASPLKPRKGGTMKKFALLAMLLCSCVMFGCKKEDKKGGDTKGGTTSTEKDKGDGGTTTPAEGGATK
jgi:hypothetical protein